MICINIITAFNKFQMHLNNKDFIIFIIFLNAFKYKIFNVSQYITDNVLFQYSNDNSFYLVVFYNKNILLIK